MSLSFSSSRILVQTKKKKKKVASVLCRRLVYFED